MNEHPPYLNKERISLYGVVEISIYYQELCYQKLCLHKAWSWKELRFQIGKGLTVNNIHMFSLSLLGNICLLLCFSGKTSVIWIPHSWISILKSIWFSLSPRVLAQHWTIQPWLEWLIFTWLLVEHSFLLPDAQFLSSIKPWPVSLLPFISQHASFSCLSWMKWSSFFRLGSRRVLQSCGGLTHDHLVSLINVKLPGPCFHIS